MQTTALWLDVPLVSLQEWSIISWPCWIGSCWLVNKKCNYRVGDLVGAKSSSFSTAKIFHRSKRLQRTVLFYMSKRSAFGAHFTSNNVSVKNVRLEKSRWDFVELGVISCCEGIVKDNERLCSTRRGISMTNVVIISIHVKSREILFQM